MTTCVIIGASVASSLSAYALAPFFKRIVILEQSNELGVQRKQLQQGNQFHIFLKEGQNVLHELIPGIEKDFQQKSCPTVSFPSEFEWTIDGKALASDQGHICDLFLMDRIDLEKIMADRLKDHPNIELCLGSQVLDIDFIDHKAKKISYRKNGENLSIDCDFLVVGGGKRFDLKGILQKNNMSVPEDKFVSAEYMYVSHIRELKKGQSLPWKLRYEQVLPPVCPQGGIIGKVSEPNKYMCMLIGPKGNFPKVDQVDDFVSTLKDKNFHDFYSQSEPVTKPQAYKITGSRHTPFGQMGMRWPKNIVALGDCVCAFNPVYAQGLSVAAMEVRLLKQLFQSSQDGKIKTHQFQKGVDRIIRVPWLMGTVEDKRLNGSILSASELLATKYIQSLRQGAFEDPQLSAALVSVTQMIKKPTSLLMPDIFWKVLNSNKLKA